MTEHVDRGLAEVWNGSALTEAWQNREGLANTGKITYNCHNLKKQKEKEADMMATLIVGAAVAGLVVVAVRKLARDKRNGKSLSCGGDCSRCKGHCS